MGRTDLNMYKLYTNSALGPSGTMADRVFNVSGGDLVLTERSASEQDIMQPVLDVTPAEESSDALVATVGEFGKTPKKIEAPSALRITDRTVYRTYLSTIGLLNLSVFVLLGAAFAFTLKFPGRLILGALISHPVC